MAAVGNRVHWELPGVKNQWTLVYDGTPPIRQSLPGAIAYEPGSGELQFKIDQAVRFRFPIFSGHNEKNFQEASSRITFLGPNEIEILLNEMGEKLPSPGERPMDLDYKRVAALGLSSKDPLIRNHFRIFKLKDQIRSLETKRLFQQIEAYTAKLAVYGNKPLTLKQRKEDFEGLTEYLVNARLIQSCFEIAIRALLFKDHPDHTLMVHSIKGTEAPRFSKSQMESITCLLECAFSTDRSQLRIALTFEEEIDEAIKALVQETIQSLEPENRESFINQIKEME